MSRSMPILVSLRADKGHEWSRFLSESKAVARREAGCEQVWAMNWCARLQQRLTIEAIDHGCCHRGCCMLGELESVLGG